MPKYNDRFYVWCGSIGVHQVRRLPTKVQLAEMKVEQILDLVDVLKNEQARSVYEFNVLETIPEFWSNLAQELLNRIDLNENLERGNTEIKED